MADVNRYRYGETNPVKVPRTAGFALAVSDLCYWDSAQQSDLFAAGTIGSLGSVKSAASYPWQGSLVATQAAFAAAFLGVNMQRWDGVNQPTGSKDGYQRVAVGPGCVFEFDWNTANPYPAFGALVGPDQAAGVNALLPQQVALVSGKANAIGRVEAAVPGAGSYYATVAGKVLVRIFSAVMAPLTNA